MSTVSPPAWKPLADAMTEAELLAAVVDAFRFAGWLVYHTHDSRRSAAGFPDLVAVHRAKRRVLFVELKKENGKTTPEQEAWLQALEEASTVGRQGVEVCEWRPSHWFNGSIARALR